MKSFTEIMKEHSSLSKITPKISDAQPNMTDKELLNAIANGDQQAFNQLYKRYYQRVVNFAYKYVNQKEIALEVANDVMMAVWNQASGFEERSSVSTWIFGIAYRQAQKAFGKNIKHDHDSFDETWQSNNDANDDHHSNEDHQSEASLLMNGAELEQTLQSEQLWTKMEGVLEKLNDEQKAVVYLTSMGYSYPEIAKMIDCPANTVKTRMFHARRTIKQLFKSFL